MSAGLTLTQQPPVSPLVDLRADDTAHRLWGTMAATDAFQRELVASVGALVGDLGHRARRETALAQLGVDALDGLYAGILPSLDSLDPQFGETMAVTESFGAPEPTPIGVRAPLDELREGPLAVFDAAGRTPTIAVELDSAFRDLRADQREDVVGLLADLANVFDVRLVCGRATAAGFRRRWHERLPVSAPCNATPAEGEVATRVEAARADLDPDGREHALVQTLAETTAETASYHELYAESSADDSRVRQCISRLVNLDLVATFDAAGGRAVELLAAGREYLETLESEIGRQQSILDCVSETGQVVHDSRVSPPARTGDHPADGGGQERHRLARHHQTAAISRWHHAATTAVARDGGVSLAEYDWETADDRGEPGWFYDEDAERLVVSAEYDSPFQWWVCVARALASPWTFRHVLTPEAFDDVDSDTRLSELFGEFRHMLRDSRCVGYLENGADGEAYIEALQEAEEHLCDLTRRWAHREFDCSPNEFRGIVTREALGLASTMVHLLDLADIDVVREARIPNYRKFDKDDRRSLATTIATGSSIQSRYGEFAAYRQLFEGREDKRESAIRPTVDTADPDGEQIGAFVVSGPGVADDSDDLAGLLEDEIDRRERHEDAPSFTVPVTVDETAGERRQTTAQAVRRVCDAKGLSITRTAVSWCHAFAATPYDTARALFNLGSETKAPGRNIRVDDIRFALSTLDANRLLTDQKPTLGAMLKTLLTADADESLTNTEIADRGGPSARSIRRHADALETLGIVIHNDAGWRLPNRLPIERFPRMARHALDEGGHDENLDGGITVGWPATEPVERLADWLEATANGPLREVLWALLGPPDVDDELDTGEPPTPAEPTTATFGTRPRQQPVAAPKGAAD